LYFINNFFVEKNLKTGKKPIVIMAIFAEKNMEHTEIIMLSECTLNDIISNVDYFPKQHNQPF